MCLRCCAVYYYGLIGPDGTQLASLIAKRAYQMSVEALVELYSITADDGQPEDGAAEGTLPGTKKEDAREDPRTWWRSAHGAGVSAEGRVTKGLDSVVYLLKEMVKEHLFHTCRWHIHFFPEIRASQAARGLHPSVHGDWALPSLEWR